MIVFEIHEVYSGCLLFLSLKVILNENQNNPHHVYLSQPSHQDQYVYYLCYHHLCSPLLQYIFAIYICERQKKGVNYKCIGWPSFPGLFFSTFGPFPAVLSFFSTIRLSISVSYFPLTFGFFCIGLCFPLTFGFLTALRYCSLTLFSPTSMFPETFTLSSKFLFHTTSRKFCMKSLKIY